MTHVTRSITHNRRTKHSYHVASRAIMTTVMMVPIIEAPVAAGPPAEHGRLRRGTVRLSVEGGDP